MINEKDLFRLTLYGARYALPVTRAEHEGFENEQVERSLQEGDAIVGIVLGRHPTQAWHHLGSDVNRSWEGLLRGQISLARLRFGLRRCSWLPIPVGFAWFYCAVSKSSRDLNMPRK